MDLLSFGLFRAPVGPGSSDPARPLRMAIQNLCQGLLPNAIGLSDAFGFTDWELDRFDFSPTTDEQSPPL